MLGVLLMIVAFVGFVLLGMSVIRQVQQLQQQMASSLSGECVTSGVGFALDHFILLGALFLIGLICVVAPTPKK